MPSKSKKKLSRSPISPQTPRLPSSTRGSEFEYESNNDELRLHHLLSGASAKFPNFINETAFVGRISDRDLDLSKGNQARVWLSEPAMVSSSIAPGSLVSVSFPTSGEKYLHDFPLDSLSAECAKHFGVDVDDTKLNEAGNYFAIATVFPSSKVLKDGVRLSWGLACTTGFPSVGRPIFVFPMRSADQLNMKSTINRVCIHKCKDLYLTLVPPKDTPISRSDTSMECASITSENGMTASPKTPSCQTMLSPPSAIPVHPWKSHDFRSTMDSYICSNVSSVKLAFADEKAKELLQASAARWLHSRCLLIGNVVTVPLIFGQICLFVVEGADKFPEDSLEAADFSFLMDAKTTVHLQKISDDSEVPEDDHSSKARRDKEACDISRLGGLSKEYADLKEIIMFSFVNTGHLPRYKGVLLHGPPGTGKTSLASSCVQDSGVSLFSINGPEIVSQYYGESEQALHEVFDMARRSAPAVIFIDELDAIAPARKDGGEELSLRMVTTLMTLMDEIKRDDILVLAATNRPDSIDPAMRRSGRLDKEIEIGVPSPDQRLDILRSLLSGMDHSLSTPEIQILASLTHGFVGADLAALCNEAAFTALRRHIEFTNSGRHSKNLCIIPDWFNSDMHASEVPRNADGLHVDLIDSLSSSLSELSVSPQKGITSYELTRADRVEEATLLKVTMEDFEKAKMKIRPSAMREVMLELPNVRWEDVGGQEEVKKQLIEAVLWPHICPEDFERIGIRPPRGLLMIGPPGCSKTLMARAVASEAKLNFLAVKGPELFSKWVGESEKAIRSLFTKARVNSPAIIFFDEIDGLATSRGQGNDGTSVGDRVLTQLLIEMDGLDQRTGVNQRTGVTVIAATNRPDKIDPALLRPGRFDRLIDVQPPDETDREDIFRIHTKNMPCHADVSMKELARLTEGYTGADIKLICRESAIAALEESLEISEISMEHFKTGIGRVQPSDVRSYKELALEFRRFVGGASSRSR